MQERYGAVATGDGGTKRSTASQSPKSNGLVYIHRYLHTAATGPASEINNLLSKSFLIQRWGPMFTPERLPTEFSEHKEANHIMLHPYTFGSWHLISICEVHTLILLFPPRGRAPERREENARSCIVFYSKYLNLQDLLVISKFSRSDLLISLSYLVSQN